MGPDNPILAVASALHAARLRDLPTVVYEDRNWALHNEWLRGMTREERARVYEEERTTGKSRGPTITRRRRPTENECSVTLFSQVWGSTALGYGGIGGSAITRACTVVVASQVVGMRAVYFGTSGRLAYVVPIGGVNEEVFQKAIADCRLPSVREAQALGWVPAEPCDHAGAVELTGDQIARLAQLAGHEGKPLSDHPEHYVVQHRDDGHAGPGVYAWVGHYSDKDAVLLG
ncbi:MULTISPECIES: hypothetical protein [unclassified Rhodanobacter]|uniref:hypothetical protein n=1 Tax=unclassified Rhodanobacter TaxID=2621553 RepID=UPI0007AA3B79|nr:hypothetical protein [Rhodanobacter sp. FW510-R10]KZC32622.1 hypothetical protein RhoFW510R10_11955 [Rhodanobacter sp. FW510-R10]